MYPGTELAPFNRKTEQKQINVHSLLYLVQNELIIGDFYHGTENFPVVELQANALLFDITAIATGIECKIHQSRLTDKHW